MKHEMAGPSKVLRDEGIHPIVIDADLGDWPGKKQAHRQQTHAQQPVSGDQSRLPAARIPLARGLKMTLCIDRGDEWTTKLDWY